VVFGCGMHREDDDIQLHLHGDSMNIITLKADSLLSLVSL